LRAQLAREREVVVGLDARGASDLEISIRVLEIEQQHAAFGVTLKVARLQARGVERKLELALVVEEPDLGDVREALSMDRGQRGDLPVEQVAVGFGEVGHADILNRPAYAGPYARWTTPLS